ncbi:MAG: hypothetical protein GY863_04560 [bacterium]|nr:hypothetical protein [bacterium]
MKKRILAAILGIALVLPMFGTTSYAQDKAADKVKILKEIAGDYEFDAMGQLMIINFYEEDGSLFGAPEGETPEEIFPVEGEELKFEVSVNGEDHELTFVRDEETKKITKCIWKMLAMDMEIEGVKLDDGK